MDTRSDNLTKVPVATKSRKAFNKDTGLRRKVSSAISERQQTGVAVVKKREIPPLTPLHRLQRFKAIRDKNLKNTGFKTSFEGKIKTMDEVATTSTAKLDINDKVIVKETTEVSNSNVIEKLEENIKELKNGSGKEILQDKANHSTNEEQKRSTGLSEIKDKNTGEIVEVMAKEIKDTKDKVSNSVNLKRIQDSNIESQIETENENKSKAYSDSAGESDAISLFSSTCVPADDEENIEIIESKSEYESSSKKNESDSVKQADQVTCNETSYRDQNTSINKNIKPCYLYNAHSRKKAIRDKNLKNKGFKTSLEGKVKTMEEVTTVSSITEVKEIKEKVIIKETVENNEVSNTNGIQKLKENVKGLENGSSKENGRDEASSSSKEDQRRSTRLSEKKIEEKTVEIVETKEMEKEDPQVDVSNKVNLKQIPDNIFESQTETEEVNENKAYSESVGGESDAVSSVSSLQAVASSSPAPSDDEEDVEIIESKSEYESNSKQKECDSVNQADQVTSASYSDKATSSKYLSSSSIASSYRSSYSSNIGQRIHGRRPVRYHVSSRKRKIEEELIKNNDHKRTNSASVPSPHWRFIPSAVNFWTPRTTPFAFPSSTPVPNLNDSMAVNIDEDTIYSNLDDSDLFSDANEFAPQPPKKSRWGCTIM